MGTAIRTPSLKASKRGWPNAPYCPSSAGSSQRDLDTPTPKELGLPSLEGEMLGSQNWKKESEIVVAKRQRKEKAHENRTKEGTRTRVGISGETNSLPG